MATYTLQKKKAQTSAHAYYRHAWSFPFGAVLLCGCTLLGCMPEWLYASSIIFVHKTFKNVELVRTRMLLLLIWSNTCPVVVHGYLLHVSFFSFYFVRFATAIATHVHKVCSNPTFLSLFLIKNNLFLFNTDLTLLICFD